MKTEWMIIPVIALTLGCTREIDTNVTYIDGEFSLYATSGDNETRTVLQEDGCVFWKPEDCITVFYGNVPGKFTSTNTEPAASAEFTGSLGSFAIDGETEFKAIYPYSDIIVTPTDEGILSLYLPSEQTAVEGTFADDLFICVAKSKDVNLHFYNVCGGVSFSLARDDIKKVVFRGNNKETLAGTMFVDFTSDGIPQVIDFTAGKSSLTLSAPDGETLKKGVWYYLVSAPQVLSGGYTMELYTDELVETITSESSVTIRRSAWGVLKELGSTSPVDVEDAVDLGLPSGLLWASCNLGASKPEEYGDYYAWGETEPYYSSLNPLIWKEGKEAGYDLPSYEWFNGPNYSITKYCTEYDYGDNGFTDGLAVLEPEDDAVFQRLGEKWRMPTINDYKELKNECSWERDPLNHGYKVTGPNGNSIFLPAAGCLLNTGYYELGNDGDYWTSSIDTNHPDRAYLLAFGSYWIELWTASRPSGRSIRPVYGESTPPISVYSVSLDKTDLKLYLGESYTLVAMVLPEDATVKNVLWSSNNELVATVSSTGVVTGVSAGSATITAITVDGGLKAVCNVVVESSSLITVVPEIIDLGLSVKWASFNLGASKPEEYGDYFAWGEIEPYYVLGYAQSNDVIWKEGKESGYNWASYKWCMGTKKSLIKYCSDPSYGYNEFIDNKIILDSEDDVAHAFLSDKWRMPTREEYEELKEECTIEQTSLNDVNGFLVTGPNGHSIFLPAAGNRCYTNMYDLGSKGWYWSSSLYVNTKYNIDNQDCAYCFMFSGSGFMGEYGYDRLNGFSIRPVYDDK